MLTVTLDAAQRQNLIDGQMVPVLTDQGITINIQPGYVQHTEGQQWLADGGVITILPRAPSENVLEEVEVTI